MPLVWNEPACTKVQPYIRLRISPIPPRSCLAMLRLIEFLRRHLKVVIRICLALLVVLIVVDAIPLFVDKHHAHTAAEHIPGFWSVFGFIACALIVYVSKAFGHSGIMTREDYYDE